MRNKGTRFFSTKELKMVSNLEELKHKYESSFPYYSEHIRELLRGKTGINIELSDSDNYDGSDLLLNVVDLYRSTNDRCSFCGNNLMYRAVISKGKAGSIVKKRFQVCNRCHKIYIDSGEIYQTLLLYSDNQVECHLH